MLEYRIYRAEHLGHRVSLFSCVSILLNIYFYNLAEYINMCWRQKENISVKETGEDTFKTEMNILIGVGDIKRTF